jgi:hypothetical protein
MSHNFSVDNVFVAGSVKRGHGVDELFRLVDEFLKRAEQERPVLVLTGCRRCGKNGGSGIVFDALSRCPA